MSTRLRIDRYYEETWWDYRMLWFGRAVPALHFGHYDALTRTHRAALINANRVLAARAAVGPGDVVLDAGCGVGGSAVWLARRRNARPIALALPQIQVGRGRALAHRRGMGGKIRFVRGDFTTLPLGTATVDVVWALESLCHAVDKGAFYQEASRVLRPGGRLVVAEYMAIAGAWSDDERCRYGEWLAGWAIPNLATPEGHHRHAVEAGFTNVALDDATEKVRRSLRRLYRIASLTFALALLGRWSGLRSAVQHGNTVAAIRQYQLLERGLWRYEILTAEKPVAR